MKTFKQYVNEIVVMPMVQRKKSEPEKITPNTPHAYSQGKSDAESGKPHNNPHEGKNNSDEFNYNLAYKTWKKE